VIRPLEALPTLVTGLASVFFAGALLWASWSDVRSRRVSNRLVMVLAGAGYAWALLTGGWFAGSITAVTAGGIGLLLWLPLWLRGMLGAGDVKFFAAASVWLPVALVWRAALLAALLGGVLGVAFLVRRRKVPASRSPTARPESVPSPSPLTLPYAVPMAAALWLAWYRPGLLGG